MNVVYETVVQLINVTLLLIGSAQEKYLPGSLKKKMCVPIKQAKINGN